MSKTDEQLADEYADKFEHASAIKSIGLKKAFLAGRKSQEERIGGLGKAVGLAKDVLSKLGPILSNYPKTKASVDRTIETLTSIQSEGSGGKEE